MKKILFLLMFVFIAAPFSAQKDKINALFDRYQNAQGVTSINISKNMFSTLGKLSFLDSDLKSLRPVLDKISGLRMLIIEKPTFPKALADENKKPLATYQGILDNIFSEIKNLNYEELMSVNSEGNKVKILSRNAENGIFDNLLMAITSGEDRMLINMDGQFTSEDISNLVKTTGSQDDGREKPVRSIDSEYRNVGAFSGIEVSDGIRVDFSQGAKQSVRVETDEDKLQYVSTEVEGGILKIKIKNRGMKNLNFKKLFVTVVAPDLKSLSASSGSNVIVNNTLKTNTFNLDVSSGAALKGAVNAATSVNIDGSSGASIQLEMRTPRLVFTGSSGAAAKLNGTATDATFHVSSAANCSAAELASKNVLANVSSAGALTVSATDALDAGVSSGGSMRYKGNPVVKSDVSRVSGGSLSQMK